MNNCFIYCLTENGQPFYIGATKSIKGRFDAHILEAKHYLRVGEQNWVNDKTRKIASIISAGSTPGVVVLEQCDLSIGDEREIFHYQELIKSHNLLQKSPSFRRYTHAYKFKQ